MRIRLFTGVVGILLSAVSFPVLGAQYLYFSPRPSTCTVDGVDAWVGIDTYHIFLHSPDVVDGIGVSFRIESEAYGPEDFVSVDPVDGVSVESGDLFSGIRLSLPGGQFVHDTLLTIHVELNEPQSYGVWDVAWTRDVQLYRATGDTLFLEDVLFYLTHCYQSATWIQWMHPDTIGAPIATTSTIDVHCFGHSLGGFSGTDLDVFDERGWLTGCSGCGVAVDCEICPWDIQIVHLHVTIPEGTPAGTADKIRIIPTGPCCLGDSTEVYVRAMPSVAVEESSWGTIKALYGDE
jgi:hypothetical protein